MTKHVVQEIILEGKGDSIELSFSDIALKMFNIVTDTASVNPVLTKTIIIRSKDIKDLLYQFLKKLFDTANQDLFLLSYVKNIMIEKINNEYMLNATLLGDKLKNHNIKDIVKLVTEKNISIKQDKEGCISQVVIIVERLHEI